jgi:ribosomal protein L11 methyltransferase
MKPPHGPELPRFALVIIDIAAEAADEATALLFELGAEGVEERDEQTLTKGAGPGKVTLVGSFADRQAADRAAAALDEGSSPRVAELVGDAWRDAWKAYFLPFPLTSRITVRPPWEPYEPKDPREIVLELEPGRAFGTGLHPTTALMARALEARTAHLAGARVLDVGTGSGILALVAAALGARAVRAIDIDADAIEVARENIRRNGELLRVQADAAPLASLTESYDIVVANIEAGTIVSMAPALTLRLVMGGLLFLSGILQHQPPDVLVAFPGFTVDEALTEGEWAALVLRHTAG